MIPPLGRIAAVAALLLLLAAAQVAVALAWLPSGSLDPARWDVWLTGGFYAIPESHFSPWLLAGLGLGLAMVAAGTSGAGAPWRLSAVLVLGLGMHLALALAGPNGVGELWQPLARPEEFLAEFGRFVQEGPRDWLAAYGERLRQFRLPLHSSAHPPGGVLLMVALLLFTMHPVRMAVALAGLGVLGAWGLQRLARHLLPPDLALAAAALWLAVPSVALFNGTTVDVPRAVAAIVVALAWHRAARRGRARSWFLAGAVHATALLLTLSLVTLLPVLVALVWSHLRDRRPAELSGWAGAGVAGGVSVYLLLWLATGFDMWDCAWTVRHNIATKLQVMERPAAMLLLNLPVFAASTGVALSGLLLAGTGERRPAWVRGILVGVGVGMAMTSPLVRGEVERVWLPFTPFLALAAAGMLQRPGGLHVARWVGFALVAQAVAVEALFGTFW